MTAPDGLVVVSGVRQATSLLARLLLDAGYERIAVEDPGDPVRRRLLQRLGLHLVHVPVDREGLRVEELAATDARVVLCTPAHQHPLGVALSAGRREQLLRWVREVDGLVLEDDSEAEFRFDRAPLACLQAMDAMHVALLGTTSRTLAPGVRLGWVVTPPQLVPALRAAKRDDDLGGDVLTQHVLARMLEQGSYDAHVRMLRRRYAARRDALVDALDEHLPDWKVLSGSAGLHLTVLLPAGTPEAALVAAASDRGVEVLGLRPLTASPASGPALVLSHARTTPDMAREAVRRLASAYASVEHSSAAAPPPHGPDQREPVRWDDA